MGLSTFFFQKAFIESLLDIYEQETEEMIDVIEESRMELRGDFMSFDDESKNLRAESRLLGKKTVQYISTQREQVKWL